jgi:hypothetical protein
VVLFGQPDRPPGLQRAPDGREARQLDAVAAYALVGQPPDRRAHGQLVILVEVQDHRQVVGDDVLWREHFGKPT